MNITLTDVQRANRVLWVRELVSGNFAQGTGNLKTRGDEGKFLYCCLGVACERVNPTSRHLRITEFAIGSAAYLGVEEEDMLGLRAGDQDVAATWNDTHNVSFKRIADFVAYSTEHLVDFGNVDDNKTTVPEGYAAEWLEDK